MILAQVTNSIHSGGLPDPASYASIGWVVVIAFSIIGGLNQGFKLYDRVFGKKVETSVGPQPFDVRLVQEFVRRDECQQRHQDSLDNIARVESQITEMRQQREQDITKSALSRKAAYDKIELVNKTVNELPDRIVSQLLNTKKLWASGHGPRQS
jgi:hypothetical protein